MSQQRNKFAQYKNLTEHTLKFITDQRNGDVAYAENGKCVPLWNLQPSDVEFVAGLWRIQNKFEHKIQNVRGSDFVLHDRLPNKEKNLFEFYRASLISCNCYGYFMVPGATKVVAKYTTDEQTYWSYGNSIEQARAFLGIRLYDEYMDLIHSVACQNCAQRQKK